MLEVSGWVLVEGRVRLDLPRLTFGLGIERFGRATMKSTSTQALIVVTICWRSYLHSVICIDQFNCSPTRL